MPNRNMQESIDMRDITREAVKHGVRTPKELYAYFVSNGWEYDMPSRPTLESLLGECGVVFVKGFWMLEE